jgi:hypothetical protein
MGIVKARLALAMAVFVTPEQLAQLEAKAAQEAKAAADAAKAAQEKADAAQQAAGAAMGVIEKNGLTDDQRAAYVGNLEKALNDEDANIKNRLKLLEEKDVVLRPDFNAEMVVIDENFAAIMGDPKQ